MAKIHHNYHGVFFPEDIIMIPTQVLENSRLTPIDKLVFGAYYTISNTVDDLDDCNPTIAKHLKVSVNTVNESEARLTDLGFIE